MFKLTLISMLILLFQLSSEASDHHDHNHDDGDYESMYFGENTDTKKTFDYRVYDSEGNEILTPLGQSDFPFAAMAKVSRNRFNVDVVYLSEVKSAFVDTQEDVAGALPDKFYAVDEGMIFLDRDGQTVVESYDASYVIIPNVLKKELESLINVAIVGMRECTNSGFTSNYTGLKCSKRREIDDKFKKFLNSNLLSCVNVGLKKAGKKSASGIHVVHGGVKCDGKHSKKSLHCAFRAIDIRTIIAKTSSGQKTTVDYRKAAASSSSWQRTFYQHLGACWSDRNIARDSRCKNRRGSNGQAGVIRWEDRKHGKHMHLSMPMCGTSTSVRFMK